MKTHFSGRLSYTDSESREVFDVHLPHSENALFIDLYIAPFLSKGQYISNELSLLVYDPSGKMVACCHNIKEKMLKKGHYNIAFMGEKATYGAETGTNIIKGTWRIMLDIYRVMPYDIMEYHMDVTTDIPDQLPHFIDHHPWTQTICKNNKTKDWYKGYIHAHSFHSDGSWTAADFTHWLVDHHMDFGCLTDHNCWSHIPDFFAEAEGKVTGLAGVELTTFNGHANIIAEAHKLTWCKEWEWRNFDNIDCTHLADIAQHIKKIGGLFIINHPAAPGSPFCSGCNWSEKTLFPGDATTGVEIWNGDWNDLSSNNERALRIYYEWLNKGAKLVAVAGPDIHNNNTKQQQKRIAYIEVFAENNSETEIINAIKSGAVCVSSGPNLQYEAYDQNDQYLPMGSTSHAVTELDLHIHYNDAPQNGVINIVQNGNIIASHEVRNDHQWQFSHSITPDCTWIAVELRDAKGELHAFANPIYFDSHP